MMFDGSNGRVEMETEKSEKLIPYMMEVTKQKSYRCYAYCATIILVTLIIFVFRKDSSLVNLPTCPVHSQYFTTSN